MSDTLELVKQHWDWIGLNPERLIAENEFGNLIMKDVDGKFWRLCPEEITCEVIAADDAAYNELVKSEEFNEDWFMELLLVAAKKKFPAELDEGVKYTLALPEPFGGEYNATNLRTVSLERIIQFSGDLGKEIKDLPDGAKVKVQSIV